MTATYETFLRSKLIADVPTGFEVSPTKLNRHMKDFQRACCAWALRRGRSLIAWDCGLGKSLLQLEWAWQVHLHTGKNVLILAPLAVAQQTVREGKKFGIKAKYCRNEVDAEPGITITNYECAVKFYFDHFIGVVLDEASILKSFDGKFRKLITDACSKIPYRLSCSATPAPNDHMELGNQAEFLGVMTRTEMLATFFVHDGGDTSQWRLKGHAEQDFWRWMASWSIMIRKPSDIGFSDKGYELPPLEMKQHILAQDEPTPGFLFVMPANGLTEQRAVKRASIEERCKLATKIAKDTTGQVIVSCELNDEGNKLEEMIGRSLQITGSDKASDKEEGIMAFLEGKKRVLVSKSSIIGFGLNLQCCHTLVVTNLTHSYESLYQFIRRCWRFGQKQKVTVHLILMESEISILENINRKQKEADAMAENMVKHMRASMAANLKGLKRDCVDYKPEKSMEVPKWLLN